MLCCVEGPIRKLDDADSGSEQVAVYAVDITEVGSLSIVQKGPLVNTPTCTSETKGPAKLFPSDFSNLECGLKSSTPLKERMEALQNLLMNAADEPSLLYAEMRQIRDDTHEACAGRWQREDDRKASCESPVSPRSYYGSAEFESEKLTADEAGANGERETTPRKEQHAMETRLRALEESAPSKALQIDINNPCDIRTVYDATKRLGSGSFGTVWKAASKATGALRAIKTISKEGFKGKLALMKKEIDVFKMVDHPCIVKLYEIFEGEEHTHLVMELCSGGDLRARIPKDRGLSQSDAAVAMHQILRGVHYLHEQSICHRDIKAENIMLVGQPKDKSLRNRLRVTDFGLSCTFKSGQVLTVDCGSPTHMAPEVFQLRYDYRCDIWSCGVLFYELLGGRKCAPFTGSTKDQVKNVVLRFKTKKETLPFHGAWADQPSDAAELVQKFLTADVDRRITLVDALAGKWLRKHHPKQEYIPLSEEIVHNLRGYRGLNQFKKAALNVIASMLRDKDIRKARDAFLALDVNGDGQISVAELRELLARVKPKEIGQEDIDTACLAIFFQPPTDDADVAHLTALRKRASYVADKNMPDFSYTEWIAATCDREKISDPVLKAAFQCFDKNGDGSISREELMFGRLLGKLSPQERDRLLEDLDDNGDGEIDFAEFASMMRDGGWAKCFKTNRADTVMKGKRFSCVFNIPQR